MAWYESFGQMRHGLMKNLFAGAEYRISAVVLSTIVQFLLLIGRLRRCSPPPARCGL